MQDKLNRRPVLDPLLLALKSRRVMIALCALLVGVLTAHIPSLEAVQEEFLTLVIVVATMLIGGLSVEDAVRAGRERAAVPLDDLRDLIKDALTSVVDEYHEGE